MTRLIIITFAFAVFFATSGIPDQANASQLEANKAKIIKTLDKHLAKIKTFKACVKAAENGPSIMKCKEAHEKAVKGT